MEKNIESFTWAQFDEACQKIVEWFESKIEPRYNVTNIVGIPRGGLVVAIKLSHLLGLPLSTTVKNDSLLVDDINDSGRTLRNFVSDLPCFPVAIATIFNRVDSSISIDFSVHTRPIGIWILFPWENNNNIQKEQEEYERRKSSG